MNNEATLPHFDTPAGTTFAAPARPGRRMPMAHAVHLTRYDVADEAAQRPAELFYLQKQIQSQTPMVIVLEDGAHVEGVIEWYDRNCLKVRGREKTLVYKSAIKYMYKLGENGL
jgi:sRNA-binding regulator protein Hfq